MQPTTPTTITQGAPAVGGGTYEFNPWTGAKLAPGETVTTPTPGTPGAPVTDATKPPTPTTPVTPPVATPTAPAGTTTPTTPPTTPALPSTGDPYLDALRTQETTYLGEAASSYSTLVSTLNNLSTGTLQLAPEEQQYLDAMKASAESAKNITVQANAAQEGMVKYNLAKTGQTRTSPAVAASQIALTVQAGANALLDLDTKSNLAIANFEQGIRENRIKDARQAYDDFSNYQKERMNTLETMYKNVTDHEAQVRDDYYKQQNLNLEWAKFKATQGGGNDAASLAQQLVRGLIAPSELSKRTTNYNAVLSAADAYSMATTGKHFDIAKADRDYKYATNINTQNTLNYLGSLVGGVDKTGNLDELKVMSDSISRTRFPALNDVNAWAKIQTGDPSMAAYFATVTEVSDQIAKILQGGGTGSGTSDAKLAQAAALFNKKFTKGQIDATIEAIKPLLMNRASAIVGDNPYLSDYADQFGFENAYGLDAATTSPTDLYSHMIGDTASSVESPIDLINSWTFSL